MESEIIRSPFFYVGDKYKLIKEIKPYFPDHISKFIEPFAGGGSVFLNTAAESYFLNDINYYVYKLHTYLAEQAGTQELFFEKAESLILEYGLSRSYKEDIVPKEVKQRWKKTFYARFNKNSFDRLKKDFNATDKSDMLHLYMLMIYGFNRMIRFNSSGNYNIPCGNVDFNKNVVDSLKSYFSIVSKKNIQWYNLDYRDFVNSLDLSPADFLYFDPPYLITFSEYNKLWNEENEVGFIKYLSELNTRGVKFAVSNVVVYKGKENAIFHEWAKNFNIIPVKSNYISYHDNTRKSFEEILVTNYNTTDL
jgi:DNA adenine methylase